MEAKTPDRNTLEPRAARHQGRRLGLALALGLVTALTAAACGGATRPLAVSATASPDTIPSPTSPISVSVRATVGTWRLLPPVSFRVEPQAAVWTGTQMLFFARVDNRRNSLSTGGCHDVAASYAPATRTWQQLSPPSGGSDCTEGRESAVWTGSEMLVWGYVNTAYNPATNRWRPLPTPPMVWGGPSVIAWTGSQMIGWGGGCCGDSVADGLAYTPATNSWEKLPPAPISGRHAAGVWTGRELIVVGGTDAGEHVFADGAAYDPASRAWRRLPPMPQPRFGATVTWDGAEVLVVGGMGDFDTTRCAPCATGFAYDPAANSWRRLPSMKDAREGHVAVWTGSRLLVWGGETGLRGSAVPPHGVAYDPATDRWSALPMSPLRGRSGALAVWTGASMIVWGGSLCGRDCTVFTDGAAYIPGN